MGVFTSRFARIRIKVQTHRNISSPIHILTHQGENPLNSSDYYTRTHHKL